MADVEIRKNEDAHRYEAYIDGERVGFAEYQLTDQLVVFTHTEVEDECEGMGVGSALARAALDDVRRDGHAQGAAAVPVHQVLDRAPPRLPRPGVRRPAEHGPGLT